MNTTVTPAKYTTHMSFVKYISEQLQRHRYFDGLDGEAAYQRANDIEILLKEYVRRYAPSGSGVDAGINLQEESKPQKLVFSCDFHHMDDQGVYDGWTAHNAIVTPTFGGFDVRITGRDRNGVKDYLAGLFHNWLGMVVDHPALIEKG